MKKRSNPISYLGWLGIVGVIGINTGDFMLQLFLIYFIFFTFERLYQKGGTKTGKRNDSIYPAQHTAVLSSYIKEIKYQY